MIVQGYTLNLNRKGVVTWWSVHFVLKKVEILCGNLLITTKHEVASGNVG